MKKIIVVLLVWGLVGIFSTGAYAKDLKFGSVDFMKVYNDYDKTKEYDKKLEVKKDAKEKELEQKAGEIKKMQSAASVLKENEKEKEREKIVKAAEDFRNLERQSIIDLRKERDEKAIEIFRDIENVVKDYAKKNNFDLILSASAVLYSADKSMDISADILKIINENYKK
ncbi:MAG: OmpH family outer membrane protein [Candidatus Omnitrophota bacterium]|nr:OmpH family outer membrane protein [Candidatus Omnitrophota bacterium]